MTYLLRHLLAVVMLPATVVVLIPLWIARRSGAQPSWPSTPTDVVLALGGVVALACGVALFAASLHHFFKYGQGTLAPWDPPRRLVVRGPYRYVRNPMIAGVLFMLFGVALTLRSIPHATWAGTFLIINAVYIPLLEEPLLESRFGDEYVRYRRHVRRFIPRLRAWRGDDSGAAANRVR